MDTTLNNLIRKKYTPLLAKHFFTVLGLSQKTDILLKSPLYPEKSCDKNTKSTKTYIVEAHAEKTVN